MAIPISRGVQPIASSKSKCHMRRMRTFIRFAIFAGMLAGAGETPLLAEGTNPIAGSRRVSPEVLFTARARKALFDARRKFQADTNSVEITWQLGRAFFDLAEWASDSDERAELAQDGIA